MPAALRRAFVAAALAWAALLVAVPYIASRTHATAFGAAVVVAVYSAGAYVCHQLPDRSYRLWTAQMPVCARCAGIYLGAAASAVVGVITGARGLQPSVDVRSPERLALRLPERLALPASALRARAALLLAALPSAATLVYEWSSGITPSNLVRFAAGIPIGVVVAWLIVSVSEDQVN